MKAYTTKCPNCGEEYEYLFRADPNRYTMTCRSKACRLPFVPTWHLHEVTEFPEVSGETKEVSE